MSFTRLERSVGTALRGQRCVLAVSGGADSMALLHAAARSARESVACVATFDHGTGPHATRAAQLVRRTASQLGFVILQERCTRPAATEAEWRAARWDFLRRAASKSAPALTIVTAHTLDDQVETVVMRVLRNSGVRGLAALFATSDVVRPLLPHTRDEIMRYVALRHVPFVEDPSNNSRAHLRNRLRHDILPALRRVSPEFDADMLTLATRAADVRNAVEHFAGQLAVSTSPSGRSVMDAAVLSDLHDEVLAIVLPALLARARVRMDRRGIARLSQFIRQERSRGRVQLSGGVEIERIGSELHLGSLRPTAPVGEAVLTDGAKLRAWSFSISGKGAVDAWSAEFPADVALTLRAWKAGDRVATGPATTRRVSRLLSDAGIAGSDRKGWPVVLAAGRIVWVPGIRRALCAEAGRAVNQVRYVCERVR